VLFRSKSRKTGAMSQQLIEKLKQLRVESVTKKDAKRSGKAKEGLNFEEGKK
jgi:hypothetical protein